MPPSVWSVGGAAACACMRACACTGGMQLWSIAEPLCPLKPTGPPPTLCCSLPPGDARVRHPAGVREGSPKAPQGALWRPPRRRYKDTRRLPPAAAPRGCRRPGGGHSHQPAGRGGEARCGARGCCCGTCAELAVLHLPAVRQRQPAQLFGGAIPAVPSARCLLLSNTPNTRTALAVPTPPHAHSPTHMHACTHLLFAGAQAQGRGVPGSRECAGSRDADHCAQDPHAAGGWCVIGGVGCSISPAFGYRPGRHHHYPPLYPWCSARAVTWTPSWW